MAPFCGGAHIALLAAAVARGVWARRDDFHVHAAAVASRRESLQEAGGDVCWCRGPDPKRCILVMETMREPHMVSLGYRRPEFWGIGDSTGENMPAGCLAGNTGEMFGPVVKAEVYVMRHGFSCSNALSWETLVCGQGKVDYKCPDPPLTDAGALRSQKLGDVIRKEILRMTGDKQPLIFSSFMTRAIETALRSFPGADVHPIPFITEERPCPANVPMAWRDQRRSLTRDPDMERELKRVKFDAASEDHPCRTHSDYNQFLNFLPMALEDLWSAKGGVAPGAMRPPRGSTIPVVVVTHGGWMLNNLQQCDVHAPQNNEVWMMTYLFQWGNWNSQLMASECKQIFDFAWYPHHPRQLCAVDVAKCSDDDQNLCMPSLLVNAHRGQCDSHERDGRTTVVHRDIYYRLSYTLHEAFQGGRFGAGHSRIPHSEASEEVRGGGALQTENSCTTTDGTSISSRYPCDCAGIECAIVLPPAQQQGDDAGDPRTLRRTAYGVCTVRAGVEPGAVSFCADGDGDSRCVDSRNKGCDEYFHHPGECGRWDTLNFRSEDLCCACGGGKVCADTHGEEEDEDGDGCESYTMDPGECGKHDSPEFNSKVFCCACGGGKLTDDSGLQPLRALTVDGSREVSPHQETHPE